MGHETHQAPPSGRRARERYWRRRHRQSRPPTPLWRTIPIFPFLSGVRSRSKCWQSRDEDSRPGDHLMRHGSWRAPRSRLESSALEQVYPVNIFNAMTVSRVEPVIRQPGTHRGPTPKSQTFRVPGPLKGIGRFINFHTASADWLCCCRTRV